MQISSYELTQNQVGIIFGCISIGLLIGLYFAFPVLQAGLFSVVGEDTTEYESREFPYSTVQIDQTSESDSFESFSAYYRVDEELYFSSEDSRIYERSIGDGVYKGYFYGQFNNSIQRIGQRGESVSIDDEKVTITDSIVTDSINSERRVLLSERYSPIELNGAKYEQTGSKIYNNRTVKVFTKTWTSAGLPTVFSDSTIYVDAETGWVLYMDVMVDSERHSQALQLERVQYEVRPTDSHFSEPPDWIDSVTFYEFNESEQFTIETTIPTYGEYENVVIGRLSASPKPVEPNSSVQVAVEKGGDEILNETVRYAVLDRGFYMTTDGEIVSTNTEYNSSELVSLEEGQRLTFDVIRNGETSRVTVSDYGYDKTATSITSRQVWFNSTVTETEDEVVYTINRGYGVGGVDAYYGEQYVSVEDDMLVQVPAPENNSFAFDKTDVSHFAFTSYQHPGFVLDPVSQESYESGTINLQSDEVDFGGSNITLKQNGETLAQMSVSREKYFISNVPTGVVQVIIEQDDRIYRDEVRVKLNESVEIGGLYTDIDNVSESKVAADDAGLRPAGYGVQQQFASFTVDDIVFSNETRSNSDFEVQNQSVAQSESDYGDETFDINTSIYQQNNSTEVVIHSVHSTSSERENTSDSSRLGRLSVTYDGVEQRINISDTVVNQTVEFNSTAGDYVEYRYWEAEPVDTEWYPVVQIERVTNQSSERGWIYLLTDTHVTTGYTVYNEDKEEIVNLSREQLYEYHDNEPVRLQVPAGEYAIIREEPNVGGSYSVFPVVSENRTTVSSTPLFEQTIEEYEAENGRVDSQPFVLETFNTSESRIVSVRRQTQLERNGTVTLVYGNQSREMQLNTTSERNKVSFTDTDARYVKAFFSPNGTDEVEYVQIIRLYPERASIENWYTHQENGSLVVYDWATKVAEFEYEQRMKTGQQVRYGGILDSFGSGMEYKNAFERTYSVTLIDDSTERVQNTTQVNDD